MFRAAGSQRRDVSADCRSVATQNELDTERRRSSFLPRGGNAGLHSGVFHLGFPFGFLGEFIHGLFRGWGCLDCLTVKSSSLTSKRNIKVGSLISGIFFVIFPFGEPTRLKSHLPTLLRLKHWTD
ncbi:MAG: hypothetical protein CBC13_07140 [Planctomycetia bacterium TMED53]|nr:MAG: hypothetical protein CBC13_07140 [Planctomycetia bacterium TMED53]